MTLNFGISITTSFGTPVKTMVMNALPWTLGLVGVTTVIAFVLGTFIGLVSAWRRGTWLDNVLPPMAVIGFALPYFWVGLLLVYIFSVTLGWLPYEDAYNIITDVPAWNFGYIGDVLRHAILPGMTIIITQIGLWILFMRNNTITVLAEDYVRMARAKGLKPWRVMWAYAGRNAILPNLTGFAMRSDLWCRAPSSLSMSSTTPDSGACCYERWRASTTRSCKRSSFSSRSRCCCRSCSISIRPWPGWSSPAPASSR